MDNKYTAAILAGGKNHRAAAKFPHGDLTFTNLNAGKDLARLKKPLDAHSVRGGQNEFSPDTIFYIGSLL